MAAFAAAFTLYAIKDETRKLQSHVLQQERQIDRLENDIAVLKAERAHLARPNRIEELARRQGLGPVGPAQYGRIEDLPLRALRHQATGRFGGSGN